MLCLLVVVHELNSKWRTLELDGASKCQNRSLYAASSLSLSLSVSSNSSRVWCVWLYLCNGVAWYVPVSRKTVAVFIYSFVPFPDHGSVALVFILGFTHNPFALESRYLSLLLLSSHVQWLCRLGFGRLVSIANFLAEQPQPLICVMSCGVWLCVACIDSIWLAIFTSYRYSCALLRSSAIRK